METKKSELVGGLTKLERDMQELRMSDRHMGIEGLNRYNSQRRIERIKETLKDVVCYALPYVVAMVLIFSIMSMRG